MENLPEKTQHSLDTEREGKTKVSILNYNLFLRPGLYHKLGKDHRKLRYELFSDRIDGYDVLNFQEIFGTLTRKRTQLIEKAAQKGYGYASVPPKKPLISKTLVDSGLLTLSKYQIICSDFT